MYVVNNYFKFSTNYFFLLVLNYDNLIVCNLLNAYLLSREKSRFRGNPTSGSLTQNCEPKETMGRARCRIAMGITAARTVRKFRLSVCPHNGF